MKEIIRAEQLLESYRFKAGKHIGNSDYNKMCEFAKEFAKIHVQAALTKAHTNFQLPIEDIDFTLEAYPLENIV